MIDSAHLDNVLKVGFIYVCKDGPDGLIHFKLRQGKVEDLGDCIEVIDIILAESILQRILQLHRYLRHGRSLNYKLTREKASMIAHEVKKVVEDIISSVYKFRY